MNVTTPSWVFELQQCLKNGVVPILKVEGEDTFRVQRLNFFDKIKYRFDGSFRKNTIDSLSIQLKKSLKKLPLLQFEEIEKTVLVKITRLFLKKFKKYDLSQETAKLKKQLLATRLSIPTKTFKENSGLYEFASKNFLQYYLKKYGHKIEVDPISNKIKILSEGVMKQWDEIKNIAEETPIQSPCAPSQPWKYGSKGVQNEDLYHWNELKPYIFADPSKWNHQWIFEVCTCNENSPQKNGDHSWLRLKTPTGAIYSIGLYRPGKGTGIFSNLKLPLRVKKGYLMQPDLSEFYPCNTNTLEYAINEDIFNEIKAQIEDDKATDEELFQVMGKNCTLYVNKIANIAGINLPTEKPIWRVICPKSIEKKIDAMNKYTPNIVRKVVKIVVTIFLNLLQVILGGGVVDKSLSRNRNNPIKPHINSFIDIFKESKAKIHHPHTLGERVMKEVVEWRKKEIAALEDDDFQGKNEILFDTPLYYKLQVK